jgi:Zn-dependent metalloprotease
MPNIKSLKAKVQMDSQHKVPRRIYDFESKASTAKPRAAAEALLKTIAKDLKIRPDLSQLKFDQVKKSILGSHVLFQQQFEGKPISGAWVRVDIDKNGKIYNIHSDLIPEPFLAKSAKAEKTPVLSAENAVSKAVAAVKALHKGRPEALEHELVYFPKNGIPTAAWKVIVKATGPEAEWRLYVDAETGAILEQLNQLKSAEGRGRVFDPNPVVALNDTSLEDNSLIPDIAYSEVTLRDIANTGFLDGPFVSTKNTPNRVQRTGFDFTFSRNDRAFKEVMVYYHIDRVQRYIQELGFDNVLNAPIEVHIDGRSDDNSHYSPATKSLTFGTGGVDDAEDAEIILHEYGHAIQDNQVPSFGLSSEGGAMGEAFGDYLAASFFAAVKPARLQPTVGNWDAVSYSGDDPPNLRRLDSTKKYPRDIVGEVHSDGEIWSACLWELRTALGGRTADQLVIAHHFQLTRDASFEDGANALITVDNVLNEGHNVATIRDIFARRGILPNTKRKGKKAGTPFSELFGTSKVQNPRKSRRTGTARKK